MSLDCFFFHRRFGLNATIENVLVVFPVLYDISNILDCGLDRKTINILVCCEISASIIMFYVHANYSNVIHNTVGEMFSPNFTTSSFPFIGKFMWTRGKPRCSGKCCQRTSPSSICDKTCWIHSGLSVMNKILSTAPAQFNKMQLFVTNPSVQCRAQWRMRLFIPDLIY